MAKTQQLLDNIKAFLKSNLRINETQKIRLFLGLNIERTSEYLKISATSYINRILSEFGMSDCSGCKTPFLHGDGEDFSNSPLLSDQTLFNSLIGKMQYLSVVARPDIRFITGRLAGDRSRATEAHLLAAKRILRYLSHTKDAGTIYRKGNSSISIYADADYGNINSKGLCTVGLCVLHGNNLIFWSSGRLSTVCSSTCEAETKSIKEAAKLAKYFLDLTTEFYGIYEPITIFNDNLPAINLLNCKNEKFSLSKHYLLDVLFIRNYLENNFVRLGHLNSQDMLADALTKRLTGPKMYDLWSKAQFEITMAGNVNALINDEYFKFRASFS